MTVWLEIEGRKRKVELPSTISEGPMECVIDGRSMQVDARMLEPGVLSLVVEGRQYRCILDGDTVLVDGRRFGFEVNDPRSLQGRRGVGAGVAGPRAVKAPMPGRVVRVLVAAGEDVAEQQGIVVIEAMKMQNELKSPKAGKVIRVAVGVGDTVGAGDVLAIVE
ncbi:MAG: biotin/lipoyl-containing protein [Edaphobacter sp.]